MKAWEVKLTLMVTTEDESTEFPENALVVAVPGYKIAHARIDQVTELQPMRAEIVRDEVEP